MNMQILGVTMLLITFTVLGIIVSYKVGYNRGVSEGWRQATGSKPMNFKKIYKRYSKL